MPEPDPLLLTPAEIVPLANLMALAYATNGARYVRAMECVVRAMEDRGYRIMPPPQPAKPQA